MAIAPPWVGIDASRQDDRQRCYRQIGIERCDVLARLVHEDVGRRATARMNDHARTVRQLEWKVQVRSRRLVVPALRHVHGHRGHIARVKPGIGEPCCVDAARHQAGSYREGQRDVRDGETRAYAAARRAWRLRS
jgi:hypothetical protein